MHRTPNTNQGLRSRTSNAITSEECIKFLFLSFVKYKNDKTNGEIVVVIMCADKKCFTSKLDRVRFLFDENCILTNVKCKVLIKHSVNQLIKTCIYTR